jgi:hypothetical protein
MCKSAGDLWRVSALVYKIVKDMTSFAGYREAYRHYPVQRSLGRPYSTICLARSEMEERVNCCVSRTLNLLILLTFAEGGEAP